MNKQTDRIKRWGTRGEGKQEMQSEQRNQIGPQGRSETTEQPKADRFPRRNKPKPYPYETRMVKVACGCLVMQTKDHLGWTPSLKCQRQCSMRSAGIGV